MISRLLSLLACSLPFIGTLHAAPRNVLFIMTDDYRPELATYGSAAVTPNLDRLAKMSLQFDRAYCQQAVCNPSRSSMLTGRRPDTLRLWNNGTHFRELNPDVTTLPLWFKEHGYTTLCVGKIFHNWHTKEKGDARSWSSPEFLHYANHGHDAPEVSGELPPDFAKHNPRPYQQGPTNECRDVPDEAYYDGRVAAEAVRVLNEVKGKPFFLAVGFWKPHAPFNAPKKYWDMYDPAKLPPLNPSRPSGAPEIAFHQSTEILGPVNEQKPLTQEQIVEMRHGYFANISYVDAQLGKVLDALEKSGQADNTIVTFAGDHGYHIGEHMLWGKTSNFDNDAHVPFFISEPGSAMRGKKTKAFAELVDLFPTLVDACGLPMPEGLEGTSLMPIVRGEKESVKSVAFTQHPRPAYFDRQPPFKPAAMGYSARIDNIRYTEWRDWKTGETIARELYDHESDPEELQNAVDDPKHDAARKEAAALILKQFPITKHE